ncbi:MAG: lipoprotein signal peptidase [Pseudomonadales bacterium]|nr:lipoprotein signal peptidase [Pseudomonadales bacterium]
MRSSQHGSARPGLLYAYALALGIIVADQLSKYWVQLNFELYERMPLLPFLDFTLVYNKGAAWSFLSDAGGWQRWLFTAISLVVSVLLVVWIARVQRSQRLLLFALACILGGAVGNLVDRVMLGQVVDFVLVYYRDWYFPAFNLADSAITVGAGCMILDIFIGEDAHADERAGPAPD